MAAYRVLQDIEAEDKLVGPMTARQLLYAGVAKCLFVCWLFGRRQSRLVDNGYIFCAGTTIYLPSGPPKARAAE